MITTLAVLYGCVAVIIFIVVWVHEEIAKVEDAQSFRECVLAALILSIFWLPILYIALGLSAYHFLYEVCYNIRHR